MADKDLSVEAAKKALIELVMEGKSITRALEIVDKPRASLSYYRRKDPVFDKEFAHAVLVGKGKGDEWSPSVEVPEFPEFCETYLGTKLWLHQLQWFDVLEGREPRDMHESMEYHMGSALRTIINTPPNHAKSTTLTINYIIWRLCKNPSFKAVVVSKSSNQAYKFLRQLKDRLTSPQYQLLQDTFAPPGGWKGKGTSWTSQEFYISGRDVEAKDPTVQAVGIRGSILGARADFVVIDDPLEMTNVNEFERQIEWIFSTPITRLTPHTGRIIIVGTRMRAKDLYSEIQVPTRYGNGKSPWTYFKQPAVLEYADDPKDWKTLWPKADNPSSDEDFPDEDGNYRRWDGEALALIRDANPPAIWSRVYQQDQFSEESVFNAEHIIASCQARQPGFIPNDGQLGRVGGMDGLRLIAGLDPATVGHTAAVLLGVDLLTGKRYVIDVHNQSGMTPDQMRKLIKDWQDKYHVHEWRVERNAFQAFLTKDTEILQYLSARGAILVEHTTTGSNKHDPSFGVMAMSSLFEYGLIFLPNTSTDRMKAFVDQLVVWQPKTPSGAKTDLVMALWFAEIRASELVSSIERNGTYRSSDFTTGADRADRFTISAFENSTRGSRRYAQWG